MNDLYLIGNGFDLAHGLKTSYKDFLLWYLKESLQTLWDFDHFEDDLIKLDRVGSSHQIPSNFNTISDLLKWLESHHYSITQNHDFFLKIVKNYHECRWVDIEYEYYTALVDVYKRFEETGLSRDRNIDKELDLLNNCFDSIKKKLVEYLETIDGLAIQEKSEIRDILYEGTGPERDDFSKDVGEKLFLYFNYTDTMELYANELPIFQCDRIHVHGKLKDQNNPIIFGYGDEMDHHYEKIENLNNNEFLRNIKSFGYFRTNNYQRVVSFIEGDGKEFTVKILGHSCGLSDRILLNTIFEHPNCKSIKIYYYQKSETENDYFEKTQEISRHFKSSGKGNMRAKIVSFDESVPLVPFIPDN